MKPTRIIAILALAVVGITIGYVGLADHHEILPRVCYSLDKTKPWNELDPSLDPRMSDGEYDKMRTQYFYDVVALS